MTGKEIILEDDCGNALIISPNEDKTIDVFLTFANELKRERYIGKIDPEKRILYISCVRGLALNHKYQAYGFCDKIIRYATKFDWVILRDDVQTFKVPVSDIIKHGQHLVTKQQGFEKQIYITLEKLQEYIVLG